MYVVPKRNDFFGYRMIEALAKHIKPFLKKHYGERASVPKLLDKLKTQICRTVGPSLATSLEPLAHHENVASLSLI